MTRAARLAALAVLSLAPAAHAQVYPASAYQSMRWRLVGPFRAGRVLAVSGIPNDPATFYFGSVDGGVWKSSNAGHTWEPLFDEQPISSIGALALAPSDPTVIYVGTGEADMRSNITFGAGVYKSTDGGAHWSLLGLEDTRQIGKVLVDRRDPDVVLVAALGHAYGPNPDRGVFRSADGGHTWTKTLYLNDDTGAIDLAADSEQPDVIYAALWQTRRTPWSQYPPNGGPGSGLYRSADGGVTWTQVAGGGFPAGPTGRIGVTVAREHRVYALVTEGDGRGLYRSDDGGAAWRRVSTDARLTNRGWYFGQVFVESGNADVVYVPNVALLKSTDGGATFLALKGAPGGDDYHDLWIDPGHPERMIAGVDQGATVSLDGGRTWSTWYNQPTAQFYHVETDGQFPYRIYGAQQDAGTVSIASRGDLGSITFRDWYPIGAGESGYIAPDPLDPRIIYGGDTYGGLYRFDQRTGQAQDIAPWPLNSFGQAISERRLRFTWTSPLVFDRKDQALLYFGAQRVLATRDGGLHWTPISPDLTGVDSSASGEGPLSVENAAARGWGVVYAIAPSPVTAGVIWAGTDNGRIHVTRDGGATWQNVTPPALPPWSKVSVIEASPREEGAAYAAVDRHRLDDRAPYIYRTHDFGRTWSRADHGIAATASVHVVRADAERAGLLYAGTELGVYVSFNDGDQWAPLQLNLPVASVRDLALRDGDLIAATHGRAFWVLDDLSPLEQITDSALHAAAFLARPARAVRIRRSVSNDTPLPKEIPHGENPPAGAVLDYHLAAGGGRVTIEIRDAANHLVRRISSDDAPPPAGAPPQFSDDWLPRQGRPGTDAGHHRFVWDLRYAPPPAPSRSYSIAGIAGQGTVAEPEGPLALPGTYRVRLLAAGRELERPLTLENDPRSPASMDELRHQLTLALELWNAMAEAHAYHEAAAGARRGLEAVATTEADRTTKAAAQRLAARVDSIVSATNGGDLGDLATVVQRADREPTSQAREAFAVLRGRLDAAQATWRRLVSGDIAALNARLRRRDLPEITAPPAPAWERLAGPS